MSLTGAPPVRIGRSGSSCGTRVRDRRRRPPRVRVRPCRPTADGQRHGHRSHGCGKGLPPRAAGRPQPSVLFFSRLLGEHFAGTRYAGYFATPSADAGRGRRRGLMPMPQSMSALVADRAGEPTDVLRLESRPVPTPEAGQALIRVKATPIHASDLHVLRGRYGFSLEFPTVGGHMECVGRIEALGPGTEGLEIGERVVAVAVAAVPGSHTAGTWQQYLVVDTQRLLPVPDRLSDSDACQLAVNPLTALLLVTRELDVQPGEWLLQTAAGSTVGRLVIQLARHR